MHKAWSSIEEVPYYFSRSSVKFQGHIALKIVEFDSNWAFPDCNSSVNSPMAMKCCTKLETAKKRCPIVFQGHSSNLKVTRDKTSPILTQIGRFRTIGRSQLSNPSDLPCLYQGRWFSSFIFKSIWLLHFPRNASSYPFQLLQRYFVLTLHCYMNLMNGKKSAKCKGKYWYMSHTNLGAHYIMLYLRYKDFIFIVVMGKYHCAFLLLEVEYFHKWIPCAQRS